MKQITNIIKNQKNYKYKNAIADCNSLKKQLMKLLLSITKHEQDIYDALKADMNKNSSEAYVSELVPVLHELRWFINHLSYIHNTHNKTQLKSALTYRNYETKKAHGNVLIYSSYNYPFQLSMVPLIGAIACNNTVIIKLSESPTNTNKIIQKIIEEVFQPEQCYVIKHESGIDPFKTLYDLEVDMVFFTGSYENGRKVYQNYSKQIIPVVLELGGKSPVVIEQSCNLKQAVKRLVWAKMLNCGQTCVAPDYVIVHSSLKQEFLDLFIQEFNIQYPAESIKDDLVRCSSQNIKRIKELALNQKTFWTTKLEGEATFSLIDNKDFSNKIWKEEIFGPLLPIVTYDNTNEVYEIIKHNSNPLAMYIFSNNNKFINELHGNINAGSVSVNDCVLHLNSPMPFGGVKNSGIGKYHGKASVDCFTRIQPLVKCAKIDFSARYTPTNEKKFKTLKKFVK